MPQAATEIANACPSPYHQDMSDELLQCFDEHGNPTETQLRSEVKKLPLRWWYGVVRIFILTPDGRLLCSKRSKAVSANPDTWQIYFGGHVGAGQTFLSVAQRELEEEAGISLPPDRFTLVAKGTKPEKHVHFQNYAARYGGSLSDLHFTDDEVSEVRWLTIDECVRALGKTPTEWSDVCKVEDLETLKAQVDSL